MLSLINNVKHKTSLLEIITESVAIGCSFIAGEKKRKKANTRIILCQALSLPLMISEGDLRSSDVDYEGVMLEL